MKRSFWLEKFAVMHLFLFIVAIQRKIVVYRYHFPWNKRTSASRPGNVIHKHGFTFAETAIRWVGISAKIRVSSREFIMVSGDHHDLYTCGEKYEKSSHQPIGHAGSDDWRGSGVSKQSRNTCGDSRTVKLNYLLNQSPCCRVGQKDS